MPPQGEFNFDSASGDEGFNAWRSSRARQLHALALRLGLPIGNSVEVWLAGEVRLRGLLLLHQNELLPESCEAGKLLLEVEGVAFTVGDMLSCVKMD